MLKLGFIHRIKFFVERQFIKGAGFQLLVVLLFIGLISVVGGALVAWSGDAFPDLRSAIWWAFLRLTDPGYLGDDEGAWIRLVSTLLTVSGYVVFLGALVAIMTRKLISIMDNLERGLTPVTLKNHLVVLGWNNRTLPLVRELLGPSRQMQRFLERNAASRLRLVVLSAEASAASRLELVNEAGIGHRARQVILRAGTAIQPDALSRVACLDASAILLPSHVQGPDNLVSADVETLKALLSITAQGRAADRALPLMVAELQDLHKLPVARRAYPGPLEVVASDATISRLLVQNLIHPGLSAVYNELLTAADGNEILVRSAPALIGHSLQELAQACPDALVLGLLKPDEDGWKVDLLAPRNSIVEEGDRVVFMASDYDATQPQTQRINTHGMSASSLPEVMSRQADTPLHQRVLILGWNRRVPALLAEMASYSNRTFDVDLVSVLPVKMREKAISHYPGNPSGAPNLKYRHYQADYMVEEELRRLDLASYASILLLSSDHLVSGEEADARALVGHLQLEGLVEKLPQHPQILLELSDPDNETLLNLPHTEVLVSPVILSHLLAQIAMRREIRVVFEELFTVGGAEIFFHPQEEYPLGAEASFQNLEKAAEQKGELALGVYQPRAAPGKRLQLNPPHSQTLALQPEDQIVVLGFSSSSD